MVRPVGQSVSGARGHGTGRGSRGERGSGTGAGPGVTGHGEPELDLVGQAGPRPAGPEAFGSVGAEQGRPVLA